MLCGNTKHGHVTCVVRDTWLASYITSCVVWVCRIVEVNITHLLVFPYLKNVYIPRVIIRHTEEITIPMIVK